MNLQYAPADVDLFRTAAKVFADLAPVSRFRAPDGHATWQALAEAGWTELGASVEAGELHVSVAAGIYRAAGGQLLVEQMTTSGFTLSALAWRCAPSQREALTDRLRRRPGVLLEDGRCWQPEPGGERPLCFGTEEPADLYRLDTGPDGQPRLSRLDGDPVPAGAVAGLSLGVGHVRAPRGTWSDLGLEANADDVARIRAHTVLVHSAALIGCAQGAIDLTRDHTLAREQFGVPIASFQALKHALADAFAACTVAWSALLCAVADGADDEQRTRVARFLAVEAATGAARTAAQLHGGIGFTWESDLHYHLKAILDGAQRFGSVDQLAVELGRTLVAGRC